MSFPAFLPILKGVVHGITYGTKVRLPHAFVMTFLFKWDKPILENIKRILKVTFVHARSLGYFVGLYKSLLLLGRICNKTEQVGCNKVSNMNNIVNMSKIDAKTFIPIGKTTNQLHTIVAGAVAGYFVWGHYTSVNYQICLYLISRICVGAFRLAAKKQFWPFSKFRFKQSYPALAAFVWSLSMWLFEHNPGVLHGSLRSSMKYIYSDSNKYKKWRDFLPSEAAMVVLIAMIYLKRNKLKELL